VSLVEELRRRRELFINLTQRELKGKYKRTVLGRLWSLANPLALMVVYSFVFAFIIRATPDPGDPSGLNVFPLWLLCGLLPWLYFANTVNQGMGSLITNEALIKKVYFPRYLLVFSSAAAVVVNWITEMVVLVIAIVIAGAWQVLLWTPAVLVAMLILAAFTLGITLMLAIANVYFRDTQYLVTILLQLGLYLAPIIYPISMVAQQSDRIGPLFGDVTLLQIYQLNPFARFAEIFRSLLYDNAWPRVDDVVSCAVWAIVSLTIGWLVFSRHEKKLAELL